MRLTLTIGLPRSGKSTWALKQECPVVSSDAIRLALFGKLWWPPGEHEVLTIARTMVRSLFFAGHDHVIFDSLSLTRESQIFWKPTSDCLWDVDYKVIPTSKEVCIERAVRGGRDYLVPVIEKCALLRPLRVKLTGTKDDWNEWDYLRN